MIYFEDGKFHNLEIDLIQAVPCSICGSKPTFQGGLQGHTARLACPNYKSDEMKHGNLGTRGIPLGFTTWHHDNWWTKEQVIKDGVRLLVEEWNYIHLNKVGDRGYEILRSQRNY